MMTLEWLMIVAAATALAASTALIVQQVLDDASRVPPDPSVRVLEADVASAFVAAEAQSVWDQEQYTVSVDGVFKDRCETEIPADYGDVVDSGEWTAPDDAGTPGVMVDDQRAICTMTPSKGLGG